MTQQSFYGFAGFIQEKLALAYLFIIMWVYSVSFSKHVPKDMCSLNTSRPTAFSVKCVCLHIVIVCTYIFVIHLSVLLLKASFSVRKALYKIKVLLSLVAFKTYFTL